MMLQLTCTKFGAQLQHLRYRSYFGNVKKQMRKRHISENNCEEQQLEIGTLGYTEKV